jgi:hypothetical protein
MLLCHAIFRYSDIPLLLDALQLRSIIIMTTKGSPYLDVFTHGEIGMDLIVKILLQDGCV